MASDRRMHINLMVIATWEGLVTKEMDFFESFFCQVVETECLVPACRKHIKGNLATNGVGEGIITEFFLQRIDKCRADALGQIKHFEFISFIMRAVATNGRHIDHSLSEFHKSASFLWQIQVSDVSQDEIDETSVFVFS